MSKPTGKENAKASNVKAAFAKLLSDTKLAQKLRKNMGLGDTLGPLEPQYGGIGATVSPSILNPALGWKFAPKKTIKTEYNLDNRPPIGGTVGQKYYTAFKKQSGYEPVLVTVSPSGVTSEEKLVELKINQNNQWVEFSDDYSSDGGTYLIGKHHTNCVLYKFLQSGVKSVVFKKTFSNNSFKPVIDDGGNAFIVTYASNDSIQATYIKNGSPEKIININNTDLELGSTNAVVLSMLDGIAFVSKNTYPTNISSINLENQQLKTIAKIASGAVTMLRTADNVCAFIQESTGCQIGCILNENDSGPSFFSQTTSESSTFAKFVKSGLKPTGKNIGISPCGLVAMDYASMTLCPTLGEYYYFGIGNEIIDVANVSAKLTINTSDVVKI